MYLLSCQDLNKKIDTALSLYLYGKYEATPWRNSQRNPMGMTMGSHLAKK